MVREFTKSQRDRLGDRLKKGEIDETDLRLLDVYRRSFGEAYQVVVGTIRAELGLEPTGRPAKSTGSISEKLRRESIRLTQIQDIAGCRLIVQEIPDQNAAIDTLRRLFANLIVVDRRDRPSHGYRAVHVIARCGERMVEIQVRTALQHLWAELSEKYSDVVNPDIKYGGGDDAIQKTLVALSELINAMELVEAKLVIIRAQSPSPGLVQLIAETEEQLISGREEIFRDLRVRIERVGPPKGENGALPH